MNGVGTQWKGMRNVTIRLLDSSGGRWFWSNYKNDYNTVFQNEIDSALTQQET